MNFLLIVCIFTAMIHLFETAALSLRLGGARTGQIATSLAFVNASFLVARLSNMLQAPLLGSMVDHAILHTCLCILEYYFVYACEVTNLLFWRLISKTFFKPIIWLTGKFIPTVVLCTLLMT